MAQPPKPAERRDLSSKHSTEGAHEVAIVCLLPERERLEAAETAALFSLLARLGGSVGPTVLVGAPELLEGIGQPFGFLGVPRGERTMIAALAAGAEAALARESIGAVVLVTPDLAGWSHDEIGHADGAALGIVAALGGAAGLLATADGDAPLREGLLVVASGLWKRSARQLVEAESWDDLVARLREQGTPIFDLRALRRLTQLGLTGPQATSGLAAGLTRALARLVGLGQAVDPRLKLDSRRLPWSLRHGEPLNVEVAGWVALLPQATEVELRIGRHRVTIPVEISRPDVLLSFPDLADDRCGFRYSGELPPLPPGIHEATLVVPPERAERRLGAVRVTPRLDIECDRVLAPPSYAADEGLPLLVEGRLVATHAPARLEAWVDDCPLDFVIEQARPAQPAEHPTELGFRVADRARSLSSSPIHRLRLRAHDARGRSALFERELESAAGEGAWFRLELEAGDRDPRTGSSRLSVRGSVFLAEPETRVELEVDGVGVADSPLVVEGAPRLATATFDLSVERRLETGAHELAVWLENDASRKLLDRRRLEIVDANAELRVDGCSVESRGANVVLRIEGEVKGSNWIDAIRLSVDGRTLVDVDPRSFLTASGRTDEERRGFRIARELALDPGDHRVRLDLRRSGKTVASWEDEVRHPGAAAGGVRLVSAEFDRLRRSSPAPVWSGVAIEGVLENAPREARVALRVDGEEVERFTPALDGSFQITRALPPGAHAAELSVVAGAQTIARLPAFDLVVRRLDVPESWVRDLEDVRAALGEAARRFEGMSSADLIRSLIASKLALLPDFATALTELGRRVREARTRPGRIGEALPPLPGRSLRVLLFSWEIPWSGHGGGVATVNLLRHLGSRHEITLLHPVHAGAEGLSEEVRESVREILTVAGDWSLPLRFAPFGTPEALLRNYTPALRAAVAAELTDLTYDLVNYEFAGGRLHWTPAAIPSLLCDLELSSFSAAFEVAPAPVTEQATAARMGRLIAALFFDAVELQGKVDRTATVTEPEARFLLPFLPGAELFVNPVAVDVERLARRSAETPRRKPARFVFVGNYRHPPNRDAARRLVERIAPLLRARLPEAQLALVGPELPPVLAEAARAAGVDCPGFVDDLAATYAEATATLAPIDSGGGMRVKLLEAMACGCPVVTTELGMNGISALAGQDYLLADSDSEFVEAASALARSADRVAALATSARAMLEREHSIRVQGERRERIWAATIAAARQAER